MTACRSDEQIIYMEEEDIPSRVSDKDVLGMYVLNEGNMGSNKCTLDFLDLKGDGTGHIQYQRNIYAERNPNEVKELGDVGNDIKIYGSRLWMVINCSNKVEVCRAADAVKIGKVDVPNCRSLAFHRGFAYVSSYVGPVTISQDAPLGQVYKIDTLTLQKVATVTVGYQPEELAVLDGKLYVANSGGYRAPNYDTTVSVIDLETFSVERQIDVAVNLHRLRADRYGQLWVSSRGNNRDIASKVYWLSKNHRGVMELAGSIDVPVSDMSIVGDSLYFYGADFSAVTYDVKKANGIIDVFTHKQVSHQLSDAEEFKNIKTPYGIIVHPATRDFYMMDAKNYVSSGELLHFHADGTFDYKTRTGDIPGHAAFLLRKK